APPAKITPPKPEPAPETKAAEAVPTVDGAAPTLPEGAAIAEEEPQNVIHIKPPIIVKHLATELGLKPHQVIAELMNFNIFANINQTIEPDITSKRCQSHGFVLEKTRRKKGGGVHKVEQEAVAPPPPVSAKIGEV